MALRDADRAVELYSSEIDMFHGPHIEFDRMKVQFLCGREEEAQARLDLFLTTGQRMVITREMLSIEPFFRPFL